MTGLFIDRPRLAGVVSVVLTLVGLIALLNIPVAQYPRIAPPTVTVSATYPGSDATTVAETVGSAIEAEVNGVDDMLYMSSTSSSNGVYSLTVTFAIGTDPDIAQVNVQNRVSQATSSLPPVVNSLGVTVSSQSPNILIVVNLFSPDESVGALELSNYASINVRDAIVRVDGVGDATILGARDYAMRIWLDPDRMTALNLSTEDVRAAIESQNLQASLGQIGAPPTTDESILQYTIRAEGRLIEPEAFGDIILRTNDAGGVVRLDDVARIELGSESYAASGELNGRPTATIAIYQEPGANALEVAGAVATEMDRLSERFPDGIEHKIVWDTTRFIQATIAEIITTLFITFGVVVAVTFLFLQSWRATLIPSLTIPVSLIGVFALLYALGMSANTVSLFALVLAIGLVVDDAIVVVENVQRLLDEGKSARDAALQTLEEVSGPVIATTLVLLAVFVPVGFLPGITGQLYREFAITISATVVISTINALTLSPALCALLLKPTENPSAPARAVNRVLNGLRNGYVRVAGWLARVPALAVLGTLAAFGAAWFGYSSLPSAFVPDEDQGAFFVDVQLPPAASLARTGAVMEEVRTILTEEETSVDVITVTGFSLLNGTTGSNSGLAIATLTPWDERTGEDQGVQSVLERISARLAAIPEATAFAFAPPAIPGIGTTGGFDYRLQGTGGQGSDELAQTLGALVGGANGLDEVGQAFSTFSATTPRLFLDLDRTRAETFGIPVSTVFSTLGDQFGSTYVNDFTYLGRAFQVNIQADAPFRDNVRDLLEIDLPGPDGANVPLRSVATVTTELGPDLVFRYNQFPSAQINGQPAPGVSSGAALDAMERLSDETLPDGYTFAWSGQSFQERTVGGSLPMIFGIALLFAYLFLVGQYESWTIPLAIVLSISIAVTGALAALWLRGFALSIYAQIGLILLVGLASKNAILIVEFAKVRYETSGKVLESALDAAKTRFRAVLMTALSFVFGVIPLAIATGAGAGSRTAIGTTVLGGMIAATLFGLLFVPGLFVAFQRIRDRFGPSGAAAEES